MSRNTQNLSDANSTPELQVKSARLRTKRNYPQSTATSQSKMSRALGDQHHEGASEVEILTSEEADWTRLREVEQQKLNLIPKLNEDSMMNIDVWLTNVNDIYDQLRFPNMLRVNQTVSYLETEEKRWYEQEATEIDNNWQYFCEKLKKYFSRRTNSSIQGSIQGKIDEAMNDSTRLKKLIEEKFKLFDGVGEGETWLIRTIDLFEQYNISDDDRMQVIPKLLNNYAQIWFIQYKRNIQDFETFVRLFMEKFSARNNSSLTNHELDLNLSSTLAREIIKSPIIFRGENEDVFDWLEKVERRFKMANWDEQNKLRFISTHLENDAYRWWSQAEDEIKSWSMFVELISRAFGSTRSKEIAFEQLKGYSQSTNQSITQYYDKVIELCRKIDPSMSDSMKLQYLMTGVRDSLKVQIALHDPQSPTTFLSYARKVEDILRLTNANRLNDYQYIEQQCTDGYGTTSTKNDQQIIGQDYYNYDHNHQNSKSYGHQNKNYAWTNYQHGRSQYNNRTVYCYNCGTSGHYARNCARRHFQ